MRYQRPRSWKLVEPGVESRQAGRLQGPGSDPEGSLPLVKQAQTRHR